MKYFLRKIYYTRIVYAFFLLIERRKVKKINCRDRLLVKIGKDANLVLGDNITMRSYCNINISEGAYLKIGHNVFFNNYCSINCMQRIIIGSNTLFGEGVKLYDHNHLYSSEGVSSNGYVKDEISIGSNVWIGSNVVILKGVTIGNNSIIGANCIIFKDVPENTVIKNEQKLVSRLI